MQIIAHRGASYLAPENTLAAFWLGLEQGADGIELDVRLSVDNVVTVLHDKNTLRTAQKKYDINKTTYNIIETLDAGSWKGSEYIGEKIPKLSDVLDILPDGKMIYIEVKCGAEIIPHLKDVLKNFRVKDAVLFGFGYETVRNIKAEMPEYRVLWIGEFGFNIKGGHEVYETASDMLKMAGLDGFSTKNDRLHCIEMKKRIKNRIFNVWTVDDVRDAEFYKELGITSLTTNRPDIMLSF